MITKEQASALGYRAIIHYQGDKCINWRVNGQFKALKTRPEWQLPLKHGLYDYGYIDQDNADRFHLLEDCNEKK